ncbi:MAG: cupin domain-containing protein [Chromatiales bacterium]|nr:MAG: cupin domain-containing protein [Chromatiales bacterium]
MNRPDSINGDLGIRVAADTERMPWTPSPSGTVWRKRVHRVGPAESGQVTSVVRYQANAEFPAHDHPEGEEILVLDGVFSDEHGDWPAGTYLLNPEGFRHAPYSRDGCVLFVKLRQFPGRERRHVAVDTDTLAWQSGDRPGVEVRQLYEQPEFTDTMRLERWAEQAAPGLLHYPGGAEFFVLSGSFTDDGGDYQAGTWLRFPAGASHSPATDRGCTLYVKEGGLKYLRAAAPDRE